ncbi:MAG TPA: hypothetical protein VLS90_00275 [Thermodesulfobacteriota bacterium]|nr:hypothetical protein [Thermodesulfobacteriota bacterium]
MHIFEMPDCGGCRSCELACSFHHVGEFKPSVSSIQILENERGSPYNVGIVARADKEAMPCDDCKDLEEPLCVQYCRKKDELKEILGNYRKAIQETCPDRKRSQ